MRTLMALTAAVILTGCVAEYRWQRPDYDRQVFLRDRYECISTTRLPMPHVSPPVSIPGGGYAAGYASTMMAYGPYAAAQRAQSDLYDACMEAKGYQWAEVKE